MVGVQNVTARGGRQSYKKRENSEKTQNIGICRIDLKENLKIFSVGKKKFRAGCHQFGL